MSLYPGKIVEQAVLLITEESHKGAAGRGRGRGRGRAVHRSGEPADGAKALHHPIVKIIFKKFILFRVHAESAESNDHIRRSRKAVL